MMDISVSGGASGAEAASAARGGRQTGKGGNADANGGFSDVLNKASSGSSTQDTDGSADGHDAGTAANGAETPAANTHHRPIAKPAIDLSDASLAAQIEKDPAIEAAEKGTQEVDRSQTKTAGKRQTKEDQEDSSDELGDDLAAHATKSPKPVKADKTDAKEDAAGDSIASDVLSLLNQLPTDGAVGAAVAATALSGQKVDAKAAADPKEKSVMGVKSKGEAVADVKSPSVAGASSTDVEVPDTEAAESTDAKTFRLSRADGRGQSMDMHLGIDADAGTEGGAKANIESVTVLDSRRYIGLAQNTNSAAVTAAISGDSEWAHAMQPSSALSNAAELTSTGKVVNTLKIQMNPIDLGLVTATMRLQGDALSVDLKVETGTAYRQLKEDHGKILEALRSQGYAIDNVTISMAPVDRSDSGNQTSAQGQSQQHAFAQQGQGGEARERQNQSGQRTAGGFNGAGETGAEGTSSGSPGSGGTGDVYL